MIVNFITYKDKTSSLIERDKEESYVNYSVLCVSFMSMLLYFLFNIATVFFDFIFGFMDTYDYFPMNPFVEIKSWLTVSGVFGYIGLILLVMLTRIYREDTFVRKVGKISAYFTNTFMLIWTGVGMASFFRDYYGMNTSHTFFYNYLLIRMILAPITSIYKLCEVYFI